MTKSPKVEDVIYYGVWGFLGQLFIIF